MNPFAFRPAQVTIWTTIVYLALLIPVIVLNESVPPAPSNPSPRTGINLTESWHDLATLTQGYHPYNSHKNDEVRNWLLLRIQQILDGNDADWVTEESIGKKPSNYSVRALKLSESRPEESSHNVTVFNDLMSNVTVRFGGLPGSHGSEEGQSGNAAYFEGTNVIVYIRGSLDEEGEWWKRKRNHVKLPIGKGGVMVNAHYDSVSTGFGATDDGIGVVTVLQLIKHFTTPGKQPKHGIVALLNNGEEDFLYGARAFGNSPLLPFVHTFLNLEGAGAGGRATLFRGTDKEVISAYAKSPDPFSTVISSDSFSLGAIKSQTDYVIFNGVYGQRGLDVAFYRPRARYHTKDDDARHASRASLWHMLSSSIATLQDLSDRTFSGEVSEDTSSVVPNGRGSKAVWFDLFGKGFVLFNLRAMFAWSLTLLIATPLILILLTYLLQKKGKYYFFSNRVTVYEQPNSDSEDSERVKIGGLRGIFRFPLAISVSGALLFGAAFLVRKFNPYIVHSSVYSVWAMFVSLGYFSFWCIMRGAHVARPSALHRGYVNIWLFTLAWAVLVAVTVFEDRFDIAAGYPFVFLQSALFLTTLTSILELFALPNMKTYGQQLREEHENHDHLDEVPTSDAMITPGPDEVSSLASNEGADDASGREPPDVTTPLIARTGRGEDSQRTFATRYRRSIAAITDSATKKGGPDNKKALGGEQAWSENLPSWTWFIQFLILGPFMIILAAQNGLFLVDAMRQTGIEGSAAVFPFLLVAAFTILLLLPLMPFIHRLTYHIPLFLLCIFIATLVYNLVAFPFSPDNKYKAFWQQTIDLDTGDSIVKFGGVEEYLRLIISDLPSAAGKTVTCQKSTTRADVSDCVYDGKDVAPNVANNLPEGVPPVLGYGKLLDLDVARTGPSEAKFTINAKNTKSCVIKFARPIKNFSVAGGTGWDNRFGPIPEGGIDQVLLWRRDWNKTWEVHVEWDPEAETHQAHDEDGNQEVYVSPVDELKRSTVGLDGNVTCIWSDINTPGTIPALDEAIQYAPSWAVITKFAPGLVEGSKVFKI
ncbi:hypothetical protein J7T55_003566 [Diaporthe amygdali]|uniref:uncharacterized protein n=1 Tax=Phomopsis amygdali TaxID=1214568 RepID=UPI0022FE65F1|nr:uncharacterized protein J7T55_003566 [Diaporthe amygdali]KAJ0117149.1 hypothetical protein J7T55_003566 [Diaporthe amygdali]